MKYNDPMNRAIIGGVRCCGKTTELIKMAARFNCLIVCADRPRADYISWSAHEMGLIIEPPQTIRALVADPKRLQDCELPILVDDVESVLETLLRRSVKVMSTSANLEPMKCLNYDKE